MAESTDFRAATQVGSHAIARQFAKHGAEVCWLGAPLDMMRQSRDAETLRRLEVSKQGGVLAEERITEYYPRTFLPVVDKPFLRSRFSATRTLRATSPPVGGVLRRVGCAQPDRRWRSKRGEEHTSVHP